MPLANLSELYEENYYKTLYVDNTYKRSETWIRFFANVAQKITDDFRPSSTLDVGCGNGILVEAFHKQKVEAYGFDSSEGAISEIPTEYRKFVRISSVLDFQSINRKFDNRKFDLVTCLNVLEYLQPIDIDPVIKNLCYWGEIVIFTSNLLNFNNEPHFNFQQSDFWDERFAQNGFARVLNYDAEYIAPSTHIFRRESSIFMSLFRQYENDLLQSKPLHGPKLPLSGELQQTSQELPGVNRDYQKTTKSKYWKLTDSLQNVKQKAMVWSRQKRSRFDALYTAARHIHQTEGLSTLANRLFLFLKGERQNSVIIPSAQIGQIQNFKEIYKQWIQENEPDKRALQEQRAEAHRFVYRPLISILSAVNNTDQKMLEKMITSVIAQSYSNWELCIADACPDSDNREMLEKFVWQDSRIKVSFLNTDHGISGNYNESISMARGEFATFLDTEDELAPNALYENVSLLNKQPDTDIIYSDEDKIDQKGHRGDAYFKPDWSPDLFYSSMYTCNLGVYRKSLIEKIGGFRSEFDGAQDYDLILRLIEETDHIYHIPKVLYHSRKPTNLAATKSIADNQAKAAQIKAVSEHFERLNIEVEVLPGLAENLLRIRRKLRIEPKVTIIIPTRDKAKILKNCVDSIRKNNVYSNYEIIIVNNRSSEDETLAYFKEISREQDIKVLEYDHQFNFAAINNFAVKHAAGELLLFLNNDTEAISQEWLAAMVEHAVRPEVGAVGARLLYPNGKIQHAGVITGIGGVAGHSHKYFSRDCSGYFDRTKAIQNFSAVTAACMMVRAEVFKSFGGFDEQNLTVAYNDIDFCLRIRQKNFLIVYTPYAELYHHESFSRGSDQTAQNSARYQKEIDYMLDCWKDTLQVDPYYNPNLTLEKEDFSIARVARGN